MEREMEQRRIWNGLKCARNGEITVNLKVLWHYTVVLKAWEQRKCGEKRERISNVLERMHLGRGHRPLDTQP